MNNDHGVIAAGKLADLTLWSSASDEGNSRISRIFSSKSSARSHNSQSGLSAIVGIAPTEFRAKP